MEKLPEQKEGKEFGKNIRVIIEFGRHEIPGKTPEGMSADFLTEKGQKSAKERGQKIAEEKVAGYASPKLRAQETVDLELENVNEDIKVINQKLSGNAKESSVGQKTDNVFKIKKRVELDTVKNFDKIMPEAKEWTKNQIAGGKKGTELDFIIQYYLDNSKRCEEFGVTTPREAASEIAYRAQKELKMTERFYNNTNVRLINITHGPKLEPFLKEALINEDGSRGFESLEEIGGSLNPGESFQFKVETDEQGQRKVKLLFREKEYEVDEKTIEMLADDYRQKIKPKAEKE